MLRSTHSLAVWLALVMLVVGVGTTYAQSPTDDSLDYFPYRAGDALRIRNADTHVEFGTSRILRDSVDGIGNIYLSYDSVEWAVKVDTAGDVIYGPFDLHPQISYRLRAKVGDRWKLVADTGYTAYATCVGIYPGNIFGEIRMVKEFHYWMDWSAQGRGDSNWYATRWIARGFGLVEEYLEPDALYHVSGAIIGGRAYGDMIAGVARSSGSSLRIAPNPFTEGATITYHLDTREHVRLTLSDALGRVVAVPVDELQEAGEEHTATIDGTALPDGTYFYHLRTPTHTASGSLIRRR